MPVDHVFFISFLGSLLGVPQGGQSFKICTGYGKKGFKFAMLYGIEGCNKCAKHGKNKIKILSQAVKKKISKKLRTKKQSF
jgi:hypothetical protein